MQSLIYYIYSDNLLDGLSLTALEKRGNVRQFAFQQFSEGAFSEEVAPPTMLIIDPNLESEQVAKHLEYIVHIFPGMIIPTILRKKYENLAQIPKETPVDVLTDTLSSELALLKIEQIIVLKKQLSHKEEELATTAARESHFRRTSQMKDKLFSIISHDIKGPLNTLNAMLDVIVKHPDAFSQEELQLYSHDIKNSLNGVRFLLENLMHWSLSQMNMMEYKVDTIDLEYLIHQNIKLFVPGAKVKDIDLVTELMPVPGVEGDVNMIDFILRNLISNALKFTERGGEVKISTSIDDNDEKIIVSVEDNGLGIDEKEISTLFYREHHSTTFGTANEKGNGLGLGLCKEFIERNKGEISVESKLGEGSKFSFTLPIY